MNSHSKLVVVGSLLTSMALLCVAAVQDPKAHDPKAQDPKAQDAKATPMAVTNMLTPADLKWIDAPPAFPAGAKVALLAGDSSKPEIFAMRAKFPANYKISPHFHSGPEFVTVISGALFVGTGDTIDAAKAKELPAGSFGSIPAKTHHFAFTKDETIVQLNCMGPFDLTYVNPADDPRKK